MIIPVDLSIGQGSFGQRLPDIQVSSILGALPLGILFLTSGALSKASLEAASKAVR